MTVLEGDKIWPNLPAANPAPASAPTPAMNLRRFKYRPFGVISDDGMSDGFLINIHGSCSIQIASRICLVFVLIRQLGFRYKAKA
jgi:hypothetical protein